MPNQFVESDTLKTTLAIIKPEGMKYEKAILQTFIRNGFYIIQRKKFVLSPELAADFYKSYEKCKNYMLMVLNLSDTPIEAIILSKVNAINDLQELIGPEQNADICNYDRLSLRCAFHDCETDYRHAIHASKDIYCARREINYFFPNFIVEPIEISIPKKICCTRRDVIGKLIEGLFDLTKTKPEEIKTWLADWFIKNNPNRPVIYPGSSKNLPCLPDKIKEAVDEKIVDTVRSLEEQQMLQTHDRCGLYPCKECKDQSEKIDLEKFLCCCNADITPNEKVVCPICDKMIVYSLPCGVGAKKKVPSASTTTSLSTETVNSSCKCKVIDNNTTSSSSHSCQCDAEKIKTGDKGSSSGRCGQRFHK